MDELTMISTMLAKPDPSADVVERGRQHLRHGTGAPGVAVRRHRAGWLTGGLGLTAAAAAAAVLVVSQTNAPTPTTHSPPAGGSQAAGSRVLSGQQLLLAAATTAQAQPERTGTYWHVREQIVFADGDPTFVDERWTRRDGASWDRVWNGGRPSAVVRDLSPHGFRVAYDQLTLAELRRLPTDPAALTRWIRDSFTHPKDPVPAVPAHGRRTPAYGRIGPLPAQLVPSETAIALSVLLYEVPAPAAVRAAAFRALAAMPIVRNLGSVPGGQALRIMLPPPPPGKFYGHLPAGIDRMDLVIDPTTTTVRSSTNYQGTTRVLTAEWTDHLPR